MTSGLTFFQTELVKGTGSYTVCLAISLSLVSWSYGKCPASNKKAMIPTLQTSTDLVYGLSNNTSGAQYD